MVGYHGFTVNGESPGSATFPAEVGYSTPITGQGISMPTGDQKAKPPGPLRNAEHLRDGPVRVSALTLSHSQIRNSTKSLSLAVHPDVQATPPDAEASAV